MSSVLQMRCIISFSAIDLSFLSECAIVHVCSLREQMHLSHIFATNVFNSNKGIVYLQNRQKGHLN